MDPAHLALYLLLALLLMLVALGVMERYALPGSIGWRARRSTERRRVALMAAPVGELVEAARDAVRYERWERFAAAGELLASEAPWTEARLVAALERLFAEVAADDAANGRQGRGSNQFEYHDSGLSMVHEVALARDRTR